MKIDDLVAALGPHWSGYGWLNEEYIDDLHEYFEAVVRDKIPAKKNAKTDPPPEDQVVSCRSGDGKSWLGYRRFNQWYDLTQGVAQRRMCQAPEQWSEVLR